MPCRPVAVVVSDFELLGGSIGRPAAARITTSVRRATAERLPVLASTASGGTRMQEDTPAFLELVEISRAVMDHRSAGLPLRLPLVTVIDTPGAELCERAEEGAIAGEIARCISTLGTMTVPTVSGLLGQGCGAASSGHPAAVSS